MQQSNAIGEGLPENHSTLSQQAQLFSSLLKLFYVDI